MAKRGRKSAADLMIQRDGVVSAMHRPEPPYSLWRDEEQDIWRRIVQDLPADWFSGRNLDLLTEYCTAVVSARRLAQMLHHIERQSGEMDIAEWTKLLRAHAQQAGVVKSLATAMRLSQQSTYGPRAAATAQGGVKRGPRPWEIEGAT